MAAAQCRSSKCTAERKGFRRELDSWRHKLIHCVGFESILAGIYGPMLLRDLNIFDDCEPEDVDDWSFEGSGSLCSFCNLQLDTLNDLVPTAASPLSSPSDDSSPQAPHMTDSCQSAHRFLQAVFHGKDVPSGYDANIPAVAQELMKKMICQFAVEYASQSNLFHARASPDSTSGSDTVSPQSDLVDPDTPLDLTVSRSQDNQQQEPQTDCVLDLSKRNSTSPATPSPTHPTSTGMPPWRPKEEYAQRSWELSEGLLCKALRDVRSGSLEEHRAALLYGIPPRTLRRGLAGEAAHEGPGPPSRRPTRPSEPAKEEAVFNNVMSSMLGGEARLVLQRVAAWAEGGGAVAEENRNVHLPPSSFPQNGLQRALSLPLAQLRDALQPLQSPTPSIDPLTPLRIPCVRSTSAHLAVAQHHHPPPAEGAACSPVTAAAPPAGVFKLRSPLTLHACQGRASRSPHGLRSSSFDDSEEGSDRRDKDKQPRKKRGRYRQYDHDLLEEAITMVMAGRLSVSKAQGVYGIPHSTLEYKVKERLGTLKTPPKRKPVTSQLSNCGSGANTESTNSGTTSAAVHDTTNRSAGDMKDLFKPDMQNERLSALETVLYSLCPAHRTLLQEILKLTHQEHSLSLNPSHNPHCCLRVVPPQERSTLPSSSLASAKADHHIPLNLLNDCDNQGHGGLTCNLTDCKSCCSSHRDPYSDCKNQVAQGSSNIHVQSCKVPLSCVCVKKPHSYMCQHPAITPINKGVSPFASFILDPTSSLKPAPLKCCNHHNPHSCSCDSSWDYQVRRHVGKEGEEHKGASLDPPCPVLKLQSSRSPSPPPLSPIPADVDRIIEDKPPSLLHHTHEGDNMSLLQVNRGPLRDDKVFQLAGAGPAPKEEFIWPTQERSPAVHTPIRCSSLDFVEDVSENLDTIKPHEKDMSMSFSENHLPKKDLHLANQSTKAYGDAQLSEIITTVLHRGTESDYNLTELLCLHQNSETKSPKTRSWRRRDALGVVTTSPNQSSARRQNLKLKRELATFQSRSKLLHTRSLKDVIAVPLIPSSSLSGITSVKEDNKGETAVREVTVVSEQQGVFLLAEDTRVKVEKNSGGVEESLMVIRTDKGKGESGRKDSGKTDVEGINVGDSGEWEPCVVKEEFKTLIVKEEMATQTGIVMEDGQMETKKENVWEERVTEKREEEEQVPQLFSAVTDLQSSLSCAHSSEFASETNGYTNNIENTRAPEKTTSTHRTVGEQTSTRDDIQPEEARRKRKVRGVVLPCAPKQVERCKRNIVPPQRFSSYVTEPRKMYYAACFSGSIFSHKTPVDDMFTASGSSATVTMTAECNNPPEPTATSPSTPGTEEQPRTSKTQFQEQLLTNPVGMAVTEKGPLKHDPRTRTDVGDCATRPNGRLKTYPPQLDTSNSQKASKARRVSKGLGVNATNFAPSAESPSNSQYISPIKLMFFSPVHGEEGVKFTLKSAVVDPSGQGEETFDPCEESSWAGTPEQTMSPATETATSSPTCANSPAKSTMSPPKCTAPSPQASTERPVEGTSPQDAVKTETGLSTDIPEAVSERRDDPIPLQQAAPPKRGPGRPRKLSLQVEKKVKRPIGRPPKQRVLDQPCSSEKRGSQAVNASRAEGSDKEDEANKNLKITVVYGRSRRSRRTVQSESCGWLQRERPEAMQNANRSEEAVKRLHLRPLQSSAVSLTDAPLEWTEEMDSIRPVKARRLTSFSNCNIKCHTLQSAVTMRSPGRPVKIKISGISVTVTTASPRQRKVQMNRDVRETPKKVSHRKKHLSESRSAKEPRTIHINSNIDSHPTEEMQVARDGPEEKEAQRPAPVRHSVRVRKPSIYLLHSVATSRSYSTALLRRSRQFLLNKANNQRKQEAQEKGETVTVQELHPDGKRSSCDLSQVEGVSLNSIFPPGETLRWWVPSPAEETLNKELSRRIRLLSSTWVSDPMEKQEGSALNPRVGQRNGNSSTRRLGQSSVVRMLFNCPASQPQSCSMEQLCSWFMQTTETQSLAIVKQTSTRNPYEQMHYPRTTSRGIISPSPQAERLRKHVKKFAKVVPKSPVQYQQAQERLLNRNKRLRRNLFRCRTVPNKIGKRVPGCRATVLEKYLTTLQRVKTKFLTRRERGKWPKNQRNTLQASLVWGFAARKVPRQFNTALQARVNRFYSSPSDNLSGGSEGDHTLSKDRRLSSKAWSPESLKECRVFLKKINSPDTEPTAAGGDSCTVTLDDGSPAACGPEGRGGESAGRNKAVKTLGRKRKKNRVVLRQSWAAEGRQNGTWRSPGTVCSESPQPPPVKVMRVPRGRGLTGPKWCDYVVGT